LLVLVVGGEALARLAPRGGPADTMPSTADPAVFARTAARYDVRYLMVVPPHERKAGLIALYSTWPGLTPVDLGDMDVLLYRVTPERRRGNPPPTAPRRAARSASSRTSARAARPA